MPAAGLKRKRAPSAKLAREREQVSKKRNVAKDRAADVEAKFRNAGGYGKAVVSCWDVPAGGIKKSPAYRKLVSRCGGQDPPPAPKDRAGHALKGGYPVHKWPPNILVDGQRVCWLPDDWAQAIKNTGPGGTYIGWVSPQGKFHYHKFGYPSSVDETIGRTLTAKDGFNGILRSLSLNVKVESDKAFLKECLTTAERKLVLPANKFHFGVISARRASSVEGTHSIMVVEAHFHIAGIKPTWYVDEASLEDYRKLGLKAKVGGKLCPARNMALDDAKKKGLICVQVSDDISKWQYYDVERQDFRGEKDFTKANNALKGARAHTITPLAAAQFMLAKMRASPKQPRLAGVFPTANAALTFGLTEYQTEHFILGDFFVADISPCRFDNTMTLKEDYDFACSHIEKHGSVLRCNRMFVYAKHSTNEGGAVSTRDSAGSKEKQNIAILQRKWPGVFQLNKKRQNEVLMNWSRLGCSQDEKHEKHDSRSKAGKSVSSRLGKLSHASIAKTKQLMRDFPPAAVLRYVSKDVPENYVTKRCKALNNLTVKQSLGKSYSKNGEKLTYRISDLRYDINRGLLKLRRKGRADS